MMPEFDDLECFKNQLAEWKFHITLPYCSWVKSHKTGTRKGKKKSLTKRKGKMKRNKRKFQKKKKKTMEKVNGSSGDRSRVADVQQSRHTKLVSTSGNEAMEWF